MLCRQPISILAANPGRTPSVEKPYLFERRFERRHEDRAVSYDFMMFKVTGAVRSPNDLAEETTEIIGIGAEIQAQLSRLCPATVWTHSSEFRSIEGMLLDGPDTWYEFRLREDADKMFSIRTSHLTRDRTLIPEICRELGLIAFDGQAGKLIGL
jgi:hypothetical protein